MYKVGRKHNGNIDILIKKKFLGIPYWAYSETIKDVGQADTVVFYLNNPELYKQKIQEEYNKINP